jgi:hypothetical protein
MRPVRHDRLLALYAIVPLALAAVAVDLLAAGGALRLVLPAHPDQLVFFTLAFNLPHVVASHLILADAEYLRHYWRHLVGFGLALAVVTAALSWSAPALLGALALLATLIHIIAQQTGLTGAQLRVGGWTFDAWKWLTVAIGIAVYLLHPASLAIAAVLLLPWFLLAARLHLRSATAAGRRYLWANQALFTGMLALGALGYPLLALLMPRVVHDLTAFYVYGVHDHNRNRDGARNAFYRAAATLRVPTWIAGPLVAVTLGVVIERLLPRSASLASVYVLSAFHYYFEAIVWRRGTPHREHVVFA